MKVRRILPMGIAALAIACLAIGILFASGKSAAAQRETIDLSSLSPLPAAKFVQTRSGRVHVLEIGRGPPVLLLHGSGRSLADWQQGLADLLAHNHRVIAFDYYGNGFSDRNPEFDYGYDLWVSQALDVLDALGVERATVVGHSVGGVVASILAAQHPERVDHVVTIGTGLEIEPEQFLLAAPGIGEARMARVPYYGLAYPGAHRAALEAAFRVKGTRGALLEYVRRQMTVDGARLIFGVFEDIRAPVLHLAGSRDANISPAAAQALSQRTGGRFELIDGASHDAHIVAPQQVAARIEPFVFRDRSW
jgi:pimeloyl-ACP methyl ester carboxylesterase